MGWIWTATALERSRTPVSFVLDFLVILIFIGVCFLLVMANHRNRLEDFSRDVIIKMLAVGVYLLHKLASFGKGGSHSVNDLGCTGGAKVFGVYPACGGFHRVYVGGFFGNFSVAVFAKCHRNILLVRFDW
jgi:hypothetical protein